MRTSAVGGSCRGVSSRDTLVRNLVSGNLWITFSRSRAAASAECHDFSVLVIANVPLDAVESDLLDACDRKRPKNVAEFRLWLLVIANELESRAG